MMHEIKELQTSIEELKKADKEHTMLITQIDEKYLNYQWQLSTMEDRIVEIQRRLSP
jgi:peptidoglycan hydrolase CwlO-like protein